MINHQLNAPNQSSYFQSLYPPRGNPFVQHGFHRVQYILRNPPLGLSFRLDSSSPCLSCRRGCFVALCRDPVQKLLNLTRMEAMEELGERQDLSAVEVRCSKHLLELGVEQGATVPEVHDLGKGRGTRDHVRSSRSTHLHKTPCGRPTCMASSSVMNPFPFLSFMTNSTTLKSPRGSYPVLSSRPLLQSTRLVSILPVY